MRFLCCSLIAIYVAIAFSPHLSWLISLQQQGNPYPMLTGNWPNAIIRLSSVQSMLIQHLVEWKSGSYRSPIGALYLQQKEGRNPPNRIFQNSSNFGQICLTMGSVGWEILIMFLNAIQVVLFDFIFSLTLHMHFAKVSYCNCILSIVGV